MRSILSRLLVNIMTFVLCLVISGPVFAKSDFNADNTSDVLFQNNDDGRLLLWTMNNFVRTVRFPASIAASWDVVGRGDFNGDNTTDVFYLKNTGNTAIAEMKNAARSALKFPGGINSAWQAQGVGDFNGDGTDDILWRRSSDHVTMIWGMNNSVRSSITFPGGLASFWVVSGIGDFNGDGIDDILYQHNTDGRLLIWSMNNYRRASIKFAASISNSWKVVGVGDFNNDGTDDVIYRKDTGDTAIAEFSNYNRSSLKFPGGINLNWYVLDVGDYNGDGTDDLLLRRSSDQITMIWGLSNSARSSITFPGGLVAEWQGQGGLNGTIGTITDFLAAAFAAWAAADIDPPVGDSDLDTDLFLDALDNFSFAKALIGVDTTATQSDIDQARFFGSIAGLARLADPYSDITDNGLADYGDLLDAFGVDVDPRDTFNSIHIEDCVVDPITYLEDCTLISLDPGSPTSAEILDGLRVNMITRLESVVDELNLVSSTFNCRHLLPGEFSETEFDYADVLMLKGIAQTMIAQLNLLLAYELDINIYTEDQLAKDTDPLNDDLDAILARYPNLASLKTGYAAYLADAKTLMSAATDSFTASIESIQQEIGSDFANPADDQEDEFINLNVESCIYYPTYYCGYDPSMTEFEVNEALTELSDLKTGLSSAITLDNDTPADPSDDIVVSFYKFFNGIDIRDQMPTYDSSTGLFSLFPDATLGGMLNPAEIDVNEDLDNDGAPDVLNGYTKFFGGFLFPDGALHNRATVNWYWGDGYVDETFNFYTDGSVTYEYFMYSSTSGTNTVSPTSGTWSIDSTSGNMTVKLSTPVPSWRSAGNMDEISIDLLWSEEIDSLIGWSAEVAEEHYYLTVPVNSLGPVESSWWLQPTLP